MTIQVSPCILEGLTGSTVFRNISNQTACIKQRGIVVDILKAQFNLCVSVKRLWIVIVVIGHNVEQPWIVAIRVIST